MTTSGALDFFAGDPWRNACASRYFVTIPFETSVTFCISLVRFRVGSPASLERLRSTRFTNAPQRFSGDVESYRPVAQPQNLSIRKEIRIMGVWADGSVENMQLRRQRFISGVNDLNRVGGRNP
jgi:hypothetical protein